MRSEGWSLGDLPGVRRFFAKVDRAIDDGRSVLVVVPAASVESGLAEQIRSGLTLAGCVHENLDGKLLLEHDGSIPDAVAMAVGFLEPLQSGDRVNRWQSYLHHEDARGKSVLVAAWEVALTDHVSYWLRLVHGSSMDPEDRPTFVFMVREMDVDVELLEKEHAPHLSVLWWWGVIGLLDSELCVDLAHTDRAVTPLRRAMLSETVGWEIDLADECARMWGSSDIPSLLGKSVSEQAAGAGNVFSLDRKELHAIEHAPIGDRPAHPLRRAWNEGNVNAWDGHVHVSVRYENFPRVIDRRFWNAQARILMPHFERQRQRLAKRFAQIATAQEVMETTGESGLLELGRMLRSHSWGRVDFGPEDGALLNVLVTARNKIAHHKCLEDDLYAEIAEICR